MTTVTNDDINIREYIDVIRRHFKMIALLVFVFIAGAFIYGKILPPIYEAKATILLRSSSPSPASQYAGLAGMLGINIYSGGAGTGDLLELLKSRAVAMKVLDDLGLTKRIKGWDDPKKRKGDLANDVAGMLKTPKTTGNLIELKAETNDAQLAADIVNTYIDSLAYYWKELNYSEAQKKLNYINAELPKAESELMAIERKLKLFPKSAVGVSLAGQGGIQRDYEIYNAIYTMLRKELESTKLEASKEIPPFSVVDRAEEPLIKIGPSVRLFVMAGFILGLVLGIFGAFFLEYWHNTANR